MSQVEADKASTEASKLMFESIKHLTTLSAGSILVLIALLEKVFKNPHWRFFVASSFICFTLSILASVRSMVFLAGHVGRRGENTRSGKPFFLTAVSSFWLAILSLVIFTIRNLFA